MTGRANIEEFRQFRPWHVSRCFRDHYWCMTKGKLGKTIFLESRPSPPETQIALPHSYPPSVSTLSCANRPIGRLSLFQNTPYQNNDYGRTSEFSNLAIKPCHQLLSAYKHSFTQETQHHHAIPLTPFPSESRDGTGKNRRD